jgi:predicted GIY-YIG superfamily endonuclease
MTEPNNRVIYILKLESEKYYVGSLFLTPTDFEVTEHPRILKHFHGLGAEWTKLHAPTELIQIISPADEFEEDKQTKIYMSRYGIDNVRGGSYCEINLSHSQISCLEKEIATAKGLCFKCKCAGHSAKYCDIIVCYKCGQPGHYSPQCNK